MANKICGIYRITSPSGRVYIGKGTNLKKRESDYAYLDCERQRVLFNSIIKYGWDKHTFDIIHELPTDISNEILNTYEILYIKQYMSNLNKNRDVNGMNLTDGGEGCRGFKWTEEAKTNIKVNKQ